MVLVFGIDVQLSNYAWRDKHSQIMLQTARETRQWLETSNMIVLTITSSHMYEGTNMVRSDYK